MSLPADPMSVKSAPAFWMLILILVTLAMVSGCRPHRPMVEMGGIDLTDWNFKQQGPARLDGKWEFYWKYFPKPEEILPESGAINTIDTIAIPGLWQNGSTKKGPLPPTGYATYRLKVKGLKRGKNGPDTLFIPDALSVCAVQVNGIWKGSSGQLGQVRDTEIPDRHSVFVRFEPTGEPMDIRIRLSNFHNAQGGINTSIWLGHQRDIQQMVTQKWVFTGILGGVLMIMGLLHLTLFLIRRQERVNLYFGIYSCLWAIQDLFGINGGCLMANLFPWLPWRLSIDLTLLPYGLAVPLMVMFFHALFPNRFSLWINRFYQTMGGLYLAYILITPPNAFDPRILFYLLVSLSAMIYLFAMLARDLIHKKKSALILAPGYLILALAGVNDVLNDLHLIQTPALAPFGTFFFILFYSVFIFMRFSRAFSTIDTLTGKLDLMEKRHQGLKLTERRLAGMLDRIDHALLAVNPAMEIAFTNHAFERLTGHRSRDILGRAAVDLIPNGLGGKAESLGAAVARASRTPGAANYKDVDVQCAGAVLVHLNLSLSLLDLDGDDLGFITLTPHQPEQQGENPSAQENPILQLKADHERQENLQTLLYRMVPDDQITNTLDRLLDHANSPWNRENQNTKRTLAVQVMNTALDLWFETTGNTKADLAEQSRLWNVYIDKDGWARTQTLDKYLSPDTLPLRPRWKNIITTGDFVLTLCESPSPKRQVLEGQLNQLKNLL